ncbi:MAG: hypothetical protein WEA79_03405 [Balneolaceae bacterium]
MTRVVIAKLLKQLELSWNVQQRSNLPSDAWDVDQGDCHVERPGKQSSTSGLLARTRVVFAKLLKQLELSWNVQQRSNLPSNAWDVDQGDCHVESGSKSNLTFGLLAKTRLAITILFVFTIISPSLFAQNGGFAGAANRIGYNARTMAMSNAMTATTSEGSFAYYNPAHAALFLETKQTDLTVGVLQFDRIFQSSGVHLQLPPTAGISFSLMRTGVKDIDGRTQSGYPTDLFDASEYQLNTSFGIRLSDKVNAGIGLKFSLANYHEQLDNPLSVGIDLGLLYKATEEINVGFAVKDLFANYSWNSRELYNLEQARNVVNEFPKRIVWGLAWQGDKVTVSGDFEVQMYKSETTNREVFVSEGHPLVITNTEIISTSTTQFRLGSSWKAHERLTLRGGWQLPDATNSDSWGMSGGFSIHLPFDIFSPSIDYAFVMEPYRISNMHIFSLRLNL